MLATDGPAEPSAIAALLGPVTDDVRIEPVLDRHPLYWTRLRFGVEIIGASASADCARRACAYAT